VHGDKPQHGRNLVPRGRTWHHVRVGVGSTSARQGDADEAGQTRPLVLVVDDFEDARELYAESLSEAGFRVQQARDGQEALDAIALSKPVLDGWEATRRIKSDASTSAVIVIAITGHGTEDGLQRATAAGADAVLQKPCVPRVMLAHVRKLLGQTT
jgi:two-component system cell cycle response regulator DivK